MLYLIITNEADESFEKYLYALDPVEDWQKLEGRGAWVVACELASAEEFDNLFVCNDDAQRLTIQFPQNYSGWLDHEVWDFVEEHLKAALPITNAQAVEVEETVDG